MRRSEWRLVAVVPLIALTLGAAACARGSGASADPAPDLCRHAEAFKDTLSGIKHKSIGNAQAISLLRGSSTDLTQDSMAIRQAGDAQRANNVTELQGTVEDFVAIVESGRWQLFGDRMRAARAEASALGC